jgi:hypothetical protein
MTMERLTNACLVIIVSSLAVAGIGCAASRTSPGLKIVPVASLATVAGHWQGLSKRLPDMRDDAWVLLMIREDGFFKFAGNRETDIVLGIGTLTIRDGTVVVTGTQGSGTLTLHDKGGDSVLVIQATLKDGRHLYMEMTRVR